MHVLPLLASLTKGQPFLIIPFGLLLLLIAVMPLTPERIKGWWDHNYFLISLGLAVAVAAVYLVGIPDGAPALGHIVHDYFSFIALVGSLFVVAGGIHIKVKGEATPLHNVVFLFIGAIVANIIGTTGASMVLIRPFIRMNKIRAGAHHVVFFIFLVSNVGGSLTPVGDPPLFLGYLRGVPFFWLTGNVWLPWCAAVGLILAVFYFFDRRSFRRAPARIREEIAHAHETWRVEGLINLVFLAVIIGAVFLPPIIFLREGVMLAAAAASYFLTPRLVHEENHFSFGPAKEVALLFAGIFVTMLPALDYLEVHGRDFNLTRPEHYYFASGSLSSVLDNAPTYANFLTLAEVSAIGDPAGPTDEKETVRQLLTTHPGLVIAVSLGAVFFGAMTYIGNGPNFMVKSVATHMGVHTPSFFAYIFKYSLPLLLPILAAVAWIFL